MNSWLLLSLLMAHVIGDFYLQSDKYCKKKEESKLKSPFLYVHSLVSGEKISDKVLFIKYQ